MHDNRGDTKFIMENNPLLNCYISFIFHNTQDNGVSGSASRQPRGAITSSSSRFVKLQAKSRNTQRSCDVTLPIYVCQFARTGEEKRLFDVTR